MIYIQDADKIKFHRDIFAGDYAIKKNIEMYVPRMDMQTDDEYKAYAIRTVLSDIPEKSLQQLTTFAVHNISGNLAQYIKEIVKESLVTGLCGSLVLPERDRKPIFYTADQIIGYTWHDNLTEITLAENNDMPHCRIMLSNDTVVMVSDDARKILCNNITPIKTIPFVFHTRLDNPPLGYLCSLALDHLRCMADYRNALHYSSLCTAYAAGFPKDKVLRLGDQSAWVTDFEKAVAAFLEFKPNCFPSFQHELPKLEEKMLSVFNDFCPISSTCSPFKDLLTTVQTSLADVTSLVNQFNITPQNYLHTFPDILRTAPLTFENVNSLTDAWKSGAITDQEYTKALKRSAVI